MQFDTLLFSLFFSTVVLLYYALPHWTQRKALLLAASYLFYAAWSPPLVILIWISTLTDFILARQISRQKREAYRQLLLCLSLIINLGLLGYFKYAQFLLDSFSGLIAQIGIIYQAPSLDIILPIGISFYTFQTISYTIDVYRRQLEPNHSLLDFSLYVTFFPQLVAGPIVRAGHFLPQCKGVPQVHAHQIYWGIHLLIFGLFAKKFLADFTLAPVSDQIFHAPMQATSIDAWIAILAFSGQIFFDFSGYSLCALGSAMILGFALPDNFRAPYAAAGFSDFWQRWHISLSSWIRDYLYVSIGGNRKGQIRTFWNLTITMLLGGLWHGASWNFALWGGLHGLYLVMEHTLGKHCRKLPQNITLLTLAIVGTYILITLAWVPFRTASLTDTLAMYQQLFGFIPGFSLDTNSIVAVALVTACTLAWHAFTRHKTLEQRFTAFPRWLRILIIASMCLSTGLSAGGDSRAFIYFQF